jgi:hypothetical protein
MGTITIAAFRPKLGMEDELLAAIASRLPLLRSLGLSTQRDHITMRSRDGTIIEVSEWIDDDAIAKAHKSPQVLALWERFESCSTYVKLDTLPESHEDFASFEAVEVSKGGST